MSTLSSLAITLEESNKSLSKKIQELEMIIQKQSITINNLKLCVQIERFKSHLFSEIIRKNTDIKIEDVYRQEEDDIVITNFKDGTIPVIVHDYFSEEKDSKQYNINIKKKSLQLSGKNFRTIKSKVELAEENPEQQEQKIRETEEAFEEIVHENNLDVSHTETVESIEALFQDVITNRIYKKFLVSMKELRNKLLGKLNLQDYIDVVKNHICRLEDIFTKKRYDSKKISSTIMLSLSALDQRLVFYNSYYNTELEPDDIQRLKICLKVNNNHPTRYMPFVYTELVQKTCNYNLCISTVKETIKRVLINPFGFSNIIYLDLDKSTSDDPYSFYTLENIKTDGKRCWKMECRLDEFSKQFSEQIKQYCITIFRRIYFDMFNDNFYREGYINKSPAAYQDCEQLLLNILILSKPRMFCDILRRLIVKHSCIQPSTIDKFNFTRDDPIIKRNFPQEKDDNKELTGVIQRLFDNISVEDAEKIWQSKE